MSKKSRDRDWSPAPRICRHMQKVPKPVLFILHRHHLRFLVPMSNLKAESLQVLPDFKTPSRPRYGGSEETGFFLRLLYSGIRTVVIALAANVALVSVVGLATVFVTSSGAAVVFIGNAIFRTVDPSHYTDNTSALAIGAAGGWLSSLLGALITSGIPIAAIKADKNHERPWFISAFIHFLCAILAGATGGEILALYHVDVGGIDTLHAAFAGALGGAILAVPSVSISRYQTGLLSSIPAKFTTFIERQRLDKERL
ncbi:hypothetical protein GALMADRAFT_155688 [Galerina marginata CBS 339.88]|uniref:Uncharacterized protein n=1 Tax=Galerina marginata (strain CBS 339.88) TaxID=685588 RepID=A0A067T1L6_GALM3|nr:hypothetical protein GALMADRAFT_155688 [Galerina marginata CBS 339.88]